MNPLLREALIKARARKLRVGIMTNATLATEEAADMIKEYGVARVFVSLDFFEETHDAIRGAGNFKRAVSGIKIFVDRKVQVLITAVVQESTYPRIEEFKKFCLGELGASTIRLSSVMPIGAAKSSPELSLSAAKTKELYNKGLIAAPGDRDGVIAKLAGGRNFYCKAGVNQCFISADGQVYACHYFQNLKEPMGDLRRSSLAEIHRAGSAAAITSRFDWGRLRTCGSCAAFAACRGGCRARAKLLAGSYFAPDPFACRLHLPQAPGTIG